MAMVDVYDSSRQSQTWLAWFEGYQMNRINSQNGSSHNDCTINIKIAIITIIIKSVTSMNRQRHDTKKQQ